MRNVDPMAREGMRVRMIHMDDERPVDEGLEGTIEKIDSLGTLHVRWDDGRLLGVIPNEDNYELLPSNEEQIDFDVFEGSEFKTSAATKNNKMGKKVNLNFKRELSKLKPRPKLESKEKEDELEETTTAGAAGAFVAPLGNKKDVVRKGFAKKVGTNVVSKGTMKNPLGKIYSLSKKTESKIIKASDILSEITTSNSQKLRDKPGAMDGSAWVGKKGWERKDELLWPGGKIADIMAKLDIDWNDSDLTLTDKETDKINESWLFKSKEDKLALSILKRVKESLPTDLRIDDGYGRRYVDTDSEPLKGQQIKFTLPGIKRDAEIAVQCGSNYGDYYCILKVNNKRLDASDWAIGKLYKHLINILISRHDKKKMTQIQSDLTDPSYAQDVFDMLDGEDMVSEGKKKKSNKKKVEEEDLEEATTFSSVFGGGFPVTPFMWAKKGKHLPSKKSLYKGGKIVQKVGGDGILSEEDRIKKNSNLHNEVNKIKWVKGGKYVKIKDRCAKYNNKPWCSQGAVDNPLELSDTTFENVKNIAKKTGIKEIEILDKIKNKIMGEDTKHKLSLKDRLKIKLAGISDDKVIYNLNNNLPIDWKGSKEGFYEKMEPRKNNTGSN